jgi:FtsP/CotA-like multicopper oxidase with cupredoxin domain
MTSYCTMCWLRILSNAGGLALYLIISTISPPLAHAAEVTYALRIENGHVPPNMQLIRVTQGDVVTLQWTADKPSIVHLHGYDIEKRVVPGVVTELKFPARATGRFQVHLHGAAEAHGHEDVLVTVDVYPR